MGIMEYQAQLLRTQVDAIPGGLRFTAHGLTVEMRQSSKDIRVQSREHATQHVSGARFFRNPRLVPGAHGGAARNRVCSWKSLGFLLA